jgi:hypothetical protein
MCGITGRGGGDAKSMKVKDALRVEVTAVGFRCTLRFYETVILGQPQLVQREVWFAKQEPQNTERKIGVFEQSLVLAILILI